METNKLKNYGFIPPVITPDHYILGGGNIPEVVVNEAMDWRPFMPTYEPQFNSKTDPCGCTVWGTENAIEGYLKKKTGKNYNFSERFIYILAHIRPPGTDPHHTAETIRKFGLIDDALLPFGPDMTFEEFIQPDPMTPGLSREGAQWHDKNLFQHEWVNPTKMGLLRGLTLSPLGISVTAWIEREGVYVDNGLPNTHWCVLTYMDKVLGKYYPIVFDSYDHSEKILDPEHNIQFSKRYWIDEQKLSFWLRLRKLFYPLGFNCQLNCQQPACA